MTTKAGVGFSNESSSTDAGTAAAQEALRTLGGGEADIVFVFASTNHDYGKLLPAIRKIIGPVPLVGCSTAGEFTHAHVGHGSVAVMAIKSDVIRFRVGFGRGLKAMRQSATTEALKSFAAEHRAARAAGFTHATCIVLSDGLAGQGEDIVESVHASASMLAQVVGGAAADDAKFARTDVFLDERHYTDAIVVVYAFSKTPIGIGVRHGLSPACPSMIVTRAADNVIHEIDGRPALDAYERFAAGIGEPITEANRDAFMITHELGMLTSSGEYKIRAPLKATEERAIVMASEVPVGASVTIMTGSEEKLVSAAEHAARSALANLAGGRPGAVLVFDCICRRIFLGEQYKRQVAAFRSVVGQDVPLIGWETYGEIALTPGQQSGWHNSTSVVAILPD
ncbi:FIST signal transduction protein [Polyangium mundeleinium]|uniref:FIST N-terminal domain-containing protein n=1 Tax=Polyangium mundeleinium TaxID=2995306 RepID=A0ABT5EUZ1_9BACT|nr:FIST N-terminal domain-containing protein [Polyangium mundeleinium]MDC0745254.1 FIST N-terminal domain-containing protein [Polyangium mundeleinium]